MNMIEYKILKIKDLDFSKVRDVRPQVVEQIEDNIKKNGFYEARVLSVVPDGKKYLVADGNHRLQAILNLKMDEVPCAVYDAKDLYEIVVEGNQAENTYAPMDLFDWLSIIQRLKEDGLTLKEIEEKTHWKKSYIGYHTQLKEKISTDVLDFCKSHQKGRVDKKSTIVEFDFTEGWFRDSGLYDLCDDYQMACLEAFINDKCNWSKQKLQQETKKYNLWQDFISICKEQLVNEDYLEELIELIENKTFKTVEDLRLKIEDYNKESLSKLIYGDCIQEIAKLEDSSLDLIITDPPYGQEYKSNRSQFTEHITKKGIANDDNTALELLDSCCKELELKLRKDAHLYFFCSWKVECDYREIISKYYQIKNIIVWDKMNHGSGDLEGNWGDRYELIIFAIKGSRNILKRKGNVIQISKIAPAKLQHPTEKPIKLIEELLEVSARPNDTVCDPFMGSGSTIKACIRHDLNYIGIELDKNIFEKTKSSIGDVKNDLDI